MSDDTAGVPPSEPTPPAPPLSELQPEPPVEPRNAPVPAAVEVTPEIQPTSATLEPVATETSPPITEESVSVPLEAPVEVVSPEVKPLASPPSLTNTGSIPVVDAAARARAYASVVQKREKSLARIIEFVQKQVKIGNADIARLLHVSDATASRYARTLVSRGQLKPEGRGRSSTYVKATP